MVCFCFSACDILLNSNSSSCQKSAGDCLGTGQRVYLLCVFVEQTAVEVYFQTGERMGVIGRGSTFVSLTRQRGHRVKCGTAKAQGMI